MKINLNYQVLSNHTGSFSEFDQNQIEWITHTPVISIVCKRSSYSNWFLDADLMGTLVWSAHSF